MESRGLIIDNFGVTGPNLVHRRVENKRGIYPLTQVMQRLTLEA